MAGFATEHVIQRVLCYEKWQCYHRHHCVLTKTMMVEHISSVLSTRHPNCTLMTAETIVIGVLILPKVTMGIFFDLGYRTVAVWFPTHIMICQPLLPPLHHTPPSPLPALYQSYLSAAQPCLLEHLGLLCFGPAASSMDLVILVGALNIHSCCYLNWFILKH